MAIVRTSKLDILWSYLGYFFQYATGLISVMFVLRKINSEELGLWYVFLSLGSLAMLIDFGISTTLVRNISYAWNGATEIKAEGLNETMLQNGEHNYLLLKKLIKSGQLVCFALGFIAFLIMIILGTYYIRYVSRNTMAQEYCLYAWFVFAFATFLNLAYNFWIDGLKAVGAVKQSQKIIILSRLVQICLSVSLVYCGYGILGLAVAYLVSNIVQRMIAKWFMYKYCAFNQEFKQNGTDCSTDDIKKEFLKVWHNAQKMGMAGFTGYLIVQAVTLACSIFLGLDEVAKYGFCLQIYSSVGGLANTFYMAEVPMLISLLVNKEYDALRRNFSMCVVVFWVVYLCGIVGFATIGVWALTIMQAKVIPPVAMILFMGGYMLLEANHCVFAHFITLSNRVPFLKISLYSGVAISVLVFLVGAWHPDVYYIMGVQAFVQLCCNNWKWPLQVMRELHINPMSIMQIGSLELKGHVVAQFL